jgi:hypothetical protein
MQFYWRRVKTTQIFHHKMLISNKVLTTHSDFRTTSGSCINISIRCKIFIFLFQKLWLYWIPIIGHIFLLLVTNIFHLPRFEKIFVTSHDQRLSDIYKSDFHLILNKINFIGEFNSVSLCIICIICWILN